MTGETSALRRVCVRVPGGVHEPLTADSASIQLRRQPFADGDSREDHGTDRDDLDYSWPLLRLRLGRPILLCRP